jgi:hypothetical protein
MSEYKFQAMLRPTGYIESNKRQRPAGYIGSNKRQRPAGYLGSNKRQRLATIPMRVFLRRGSMLCAVELVVLFAICQWFTNGLWPVGIKRYVLLGLVLMFLAIRYSSGSAQITDVRQFAGRVSGLQTLIVIVGAICSGFFLSWFFDG